ncbi:alcohol dehydrogenase-like protein [Streptomyces sp. 846.5]|nr:zinc-binding dehydrogenase [Streptomyces sp. 846.5]TDU05948.1 alcohol dehydrogenase-like protein [Streptomyces sp. 846.5]
MSEAVVAGEYGGPEVLSVVDVVVPEPGAGQVRIAVRAVGVNPVDYKMYSGAFGTDPANLPMRLGAEAAGVVTAVGAGANGPAGADLVGTDEAVDVSVELVADRSRIATIAAFERGARSGVRLLGGGPGADPGAEIRAAARLQLTEAVATGGLRVLVAGSYPLREAAAAHRKIMAGHTTGKIVLVP